MGQEIERKFLVKDDSYKLEAYAHSHIVQGYICSARGRTVRVRIRDNKGYLTIKGASNDSGTSRYEWEKEMTVREVNTKLYTLWRLDRFTFASEDMEGVIRKLSRWYNVEFFFSNPSMKQKRFTGSLPKYADISQVLKMIEMTTDVKFEIKENTIIIR